MKIARSIAAALLVTGAGLVGAGCGGGDQGTGQVVTETQEAEDSRAAMQRALKENPNMYKPAQGSANRRP